MARGDAVGVAANGFAEEGLVVRFVEGGRGEAEGDRVTADGEGLDDGTEGEEFDRFGGGGHGVNGCDCEWSSGLVWLVSMSLLLGGGLVTDIELGMEFKQVSVQSSMVKVNGEKFQWPPSS